MTGKLIKREKSVHKEREHYVKMKTNIRVMFLHIKKQQRLPTKHLKLGERHGTDFPSQPSEGTSFPNILILNF